MINREMVRDAAMNLPPQERAGLVMELWESLEEEPTSIQLSPAQEAELERCWQAYLHDPKAGEDWETVKKQILGPRA